MFAVNGVRVLGVDIRSEVIESLRKGDVSGLESEVASLVGLAIHSGNLELSTEVTTCDAYIIAVPTPVDTSHEADLSYVRSALNSVLETSPRGSLVVVESTIPPGTMRHVVIEELRSRRLEPGIDILVAHCPERVLPGSTMLELVNNDRVIGGFNAESAARAAELYSIFVKGRIHQTDMTTAELVKVMENTYRDVNIALANEFAKLSSTIGVDVWEAIRLANNHPRVNILRPGPGVGGHCVAVDPWFLIQLDAASTRLVRAAREVNDAMPGYVVDRLVSEIQVDDGHVAVLGLAYRAELGDVRESPAVEVVKLLEKRKIRVRAHDPYVHEADLGFANMSLSDALTGAVAVVVLTDHRTFLEMDPSSIAKIVRSRTVFDTRGSLPLASWSRAGFKVITLGKPSHANG